MFGFFKQLRRCRIERKAYILAQLIAGPFDRSGDHFQCRVATGQVGSKTTLIADRCVQVLIVENFLEAMEDFRADAQPLRGNWVRRPA